MRPADTPESDTPSGAARLAPDLAARAEALVRRFPDCFWTWRPDARVQTVDDARLVIHHLRTRGGHDAWHAAQDLHACLSPRSRRTP